MSNIIEDFLSSQPNAGTRKMYRINLRDFFNFIGISADDYFNDGRNYRSDINSYLEHLNKEELSPATIKSKIGAVRLLLVAKEIAIPRNFWKNLKLFGDPITRDKIPEPEHLQRILLQSDCRGRALFLFLESTGMRLGDALRINVKQLELDKNPARVALTSQKTGRRYVAFISKEAVQSLEEWLKIRDTWQDKKLSLCNSHSNDICKVKSSKTDKVFPFSGASAQKLWRKAITNAHLNQRDTNSNRMLYHIHTLRKYFRTYISTIVSEDVAEALLGHTRGLNAIYCRIDENKLAEEYLRAEKNLSVFEKTVDNTIMQTEMKKIKQELSDLRSFISMLKQVSKSLRLLNDLVQSLGEPDITAEDLKEIPF